MEPRLQMPRPQVMNPRPNLVQPRSQVPQAWIQSSSPIGQFSSNQLASDIAPMRVGSSERSAVIGGAYPPMTGSPRPSISPTPIGMYAPMQNTSPHPPGARQLSPRQPGTLAVQTPSPRQPMGQQVPSPRQQFPSPRQPATNHFGLAYPSAPVATSNQTMTSAPRFNPIPQYESRDPYHQPRFNPQSMASSKHPLDGLGMEDPGWSRDRRFAGYAVAAPGGQWDRLLAAGGEPGLHDPAMNLHDARRNLPPTPESMLSLHEPSGLGYRDSAPRLQQTDAMAYRTALSLRDTAGGMSPGAASLRAADSTSVQRSTSSPLGPPHAHHMAVHPMGSGMSQGASGPGMSMGPSGMSQGPPGAGMSQGPTGGGISQGLPGSGMSQGPSVAGMSQGPAGAGMSPGPPGAGMSQGPAGAGMSQVHPALTERQSMMAAAMLGESLRQPASVNLQQQQQQMLSHQGLSLRDGSVMMGHHHHQMGGLNPQQQQQRGMDQSYEQLVSGIRGVSKTDGAMDSDRGRSG